MNGRRRRGGWIAAAGLLGVLLAPSLAPIRRAVAERLTRLRFLGDPVAPFLGAPCHRRSASQAPVASHAEVAP